MLASSWTTSSEVHIVFWSHPPAHFPQERRDASRLRCFKRRQAIAIGQEEVRGACDHTGLISVRPVILDVGYVIASRSQAGGMDAAAVLDWDQFVVGPVRDENTWCARLHVHGHEPG